jgi:hypothetical protein
LLVQLSGRNNRNANMTGTSPRASVSNTRVWQLEVFDTDRMRALLGNRSVVDHQHGIAAVDEPIRVVRLNGFRHLLADRQLAAEPHRMGTCRTDLGTIALIVAPLTERDLFNDPVAARSLLDGAVAYAARLGTRCVSLTGLIPAATNLGRDLTAPDGIALTTGHAALALPPELMPFARDSRLQAMLPSSTAVTGCLLSSLLPDVTSLAPTLGDVTAQECRQHWQAFAALGIDAAPLHCSAWTPTPSDITRFKTSVLEMAWDSSSMAESG